MTFDQHKLTADYNYYMHLIRIGAYEERSSEHYETDTWPEDYVEESIHNLEELAARHGLEFCWDISTKTWSLLPMSDETRRARTRAHDPAYQEIPHDGWSDKLAERGY